MKANPYESAYHWQNKIIELEQGKQIIEEQIKDAKQLMADAIERGEATGKTTIDGYTVKTERKTKEVRTIRLDLLKKSKPDIIMHFGVFDAQFVTQYISPEMRRELINDNDMDRAYKLKLGDLDKALGGKQNSINYVDIDIKETQTKTITRMEPAPIVEV